MTAIAARSAEAYPEFNKDWGVEVQGLLQASQERSTGRCGCSPVRLLSAAHRLCQRGEPAPLASGRAPGTRCRCAPRSARAGRNSSGNCSWKAACLRLWRCMGLGLCVGRDWSARCVDRDAPRRRSDAGHDSPHVHVRGVGHGGRVVRPGSGPVRIANEPAAVAHDSWWLSQRPASSVASGISGCRGGRSACRCRAPHAQFSPSLTGGYGVQQRSCRHRPVFSSAGVVPN